MDKLAMILAIVNIPVYLFIGWLVFDDKENAAETVFEAAVAVLKTILFPRFVRVLMGDDDEGAWGLVPIAAFLIACGAIVAGEHYLITKYILGGSY